MADEPTYILFKNAFDWLPGENWTTLLGAAVKDFWNPLDNHTPADPATYRSKPREDPFPHSSIITESERGRGNELALQGLGSLKWNRKMTYNLNMNGKAIIVKRLQNVDKYWKAVTQDEEFAAKVTEWVSDKRWGRSKYKVCLIVGLLLCEDPVFSLTRGEVKEHEVRAELPVGPILTAAGASQGIVLPLNDVGNPVAGTSSKQSAQKSLSGRKDGQQIFAISVKLIDLKDGRLQVTPKGPKVPPHLHLDKDDGDDSDEEPYADLDDVELREPDAEDLAELLE